MGQQGESVAAWDAIVGYGVVDQIARDLLEHPEWAIEPPDNEGNKSLHTNNGANYTGHTINYYHAAGALAVAQRQIAIIPPGNRTEVFYRTSEAAFLDVKAHHGKGGLITKALPSFKVVRFELDANSRPDRDLLPESFCTIRAATDSLGPLVVSTLHLGPPHQLITEFELSPDINTIVTPDRTIPASDVFAMLALIM